MRKSTLKGAALAALAGTVLQFGGCLNLNRLVGSILDHAVYNVVSPFIPDVSGILGGDGDAE